MEQFFTSSYRTKVPYEVKISMDNLELAMEDVLKLCK